MLPLKGMIFHATHNLKNEFNFWCWQASCCVHHISFPSALCWSQTADMRILIIGGTRFSGRKISLEALARGHDLTIFHRGGGGNTLCRDLEKSPATVIIGDRDSEKDLKGLSSGEKWDVTIDMCAYRPNQIDKLKSALGTRGGKYILISSISAYSEDNPYGCMESNARLIDLSPVQGDNIDTDLIAIDEVTYGALKVLCEQRVAALYSSNYLVVRPSYIIGPHDYSMRFPTWVQRVQQAHESFASTKQAVEVEAPCPPSNPMQFVDARDLAQFVIHLAEEDTREVGAVHVAMENHITFEQMLDTIREAVHQNIIQRDGAAEQEQAGVPEYITFKWLPVNDAISRAEEFPMWDPPGAPSPLMAVCSEKARAWGLQCRPLRESVWGVMDWLAEEAKDKKNKDVVQE